MIVHDKISFTTPSGTVTSDSIGSGVELPIRAASIIFVVNTTNAAAVEFQMSANNNDWYTIEALGGSLNGDVAKSISDQDHLFKYIRPVFRAGSGTNGTITECSVHFRYAKR